MSKKVSFLVAICFVVLCVGHLTASVFDKKNEAESLYGKGVHAFFDADYQKTIELLTKVEELGSDDPRPYFFLGLAQWRLKLNDEAEATFKKAAKFEWEGRSAADYKVSDALKRIQGKERLYVESFRRQAKSDWEKTDQIRQQERYGQDQVRDRSILALLSKGSELPPPPEPKPFIGAAPFGARSVDPFRNPDGTDAPSRLIPTDDIIPIAKPVKTQTSGPAAPAVKEDDLFGTTDNEIDDEDPFGTEDDEEDDTDPFGWPSVDENKADESKKDAEKDETNVDDNDPFGMLSSNNDDENEEDDGESKQDETKDKMDDDDDDPFKE